MSALPLHAAPDELYFAYGSNLDAEDWSRFCDEHGFDAGVLQPIGPGTLAHEALVFDYRSARRQGGALNIRTQPGSAVEGYIFAIRGNDWRALDVKEGHPLRYRREPVIVVDSLGRAMQAQTYRVIPAMRVGFIAPAPAYLAICRRGRARRGLSVEQLDAAAAAALASTRGA